METTCESLGVAVFADFYDRTIQSIFFLNTDYTTETLKMNKV